MIDEHFKYKQYSGCMHWEIQGGVVCLVNCAIRPGWAISSAKCERFRICSQCRRMIL